MEVRYTEIQGFLTPLDFYLWGHAKEESYKENIYNIVQLEQKILQVFEEPKDDDTLQSVQLSLIRRAQLCMQQPGQRSQ